LQRYNVLLKSIFALLAIIALSLILFVWRLSNGPIALDWFRPYLHEALSENNIGLDIDFKDSVLTWRSSDQSVEGLSGLEIRLIDLSIIDQEGGISLQVPEAGAHFSALALLRGVLAPTIVEFSDLSIDYTLSEESWKPTDNRPIMEKLEAFVEDFQSSSKLVQRLSRQLLSAPDVSHSAGYLRHIIFKNTNIVITDELSGQIWEMPNSILNIKRTEKGLSSRIQGDISVEKSDFMPLLLFVNFDNDAKKADVKFQFSNLHPSALAGKVAALSTISTLDLPLGGLLEFSIENDFEIPLITFEFYAEKGKLNPGNIYPEPIDLDGAFVAGYIQRDEQVFQLDKFSAYFGKTEINGDGLLYGTLEKPGIALRAEVNYLPFVDLKTYWPENFAKGAHRWITRNMVAGLIPNGELDVYIKPEMWDLPKLDDNVFTFKFDFIDSEAHYLRPMPTLKKAHGIASLNMSQFMLTADGGTIGDLTVEEANLVFSDVMIKGKAIADIVITMSGDVKEVLRVIDYKPLGYPSKYGIAEGSITGQANTTLSLQFPLIKKLKLKDVSFDVVADIKDLAIAKLTDNLALSGGMLSLSVDKDGIEASGDILLNDVAFKARWLEDFSKASTLPTQYSIQGIIEGEGWNVFNLPFEAYVEGPAAVSLELFGKGGRINHGKGIFDLKESRAHFDPLGWIKEKEKAASVSFDLKFPEKTRLEVENIKLLSDNLEAVMNLSMVEDRVTKLDVENITGHETDLSMTMNWNEKYAYYQTRILGNKFFAPPLLDIILSPAKDKEAILLPDFYLEGELKQVLTNNGVLVENVALKTEFFDNDATRLDLRGLLSGDKAIHINIEPDENHRKLTFTSTDGGAALRGLDLFSLGVNGDMEIKADMVKKEGGISLDGNAKVKDFTVVQSPVFAKLLEEKKFAKAQEELEKNGIHFKQGEMTFSQFDGILNIDKAIAKGSTLGMTISGTVDQSYDEVNLSGTLIPAYGLNSLLSNIPLVGTLLTGGKGQGIFAATYQMRGSMKDPNISINPLSVLAPGILRNIFQIFDGKKQKSLREEAEELEKTIPDSNKDNNKDNKGPDSNS